MILVGHALYIAHSQSSIDDAYLFDKIHSYIMLLLRGSKLTCFLTCKLLSSKRGRLLSLPDFDDSKRTRKTKLI